MVKPKVKMQKVSFNSVDEFLESLPADELKVVEVLRKIIFNAVPDIIEKLSYNVPFYSRHKNIFFIWPAAVLWGTKKSYEGVRLGFSKGYLMNDENNYLDKGDRKQIYYKDFLNLKEIDTEMLQPYIYEAAIIDEQFGRKK